LEYSVRRSDARNQDGVRIGSGGGEWRWLEKNSVQRMAFKRLKLTPATTISKRESAISQFKNVLKLRSQALDHTV
jgi:hypothetical protein